MAPRSNSSSPTLAKIVIPRGKSEAERRLGAIAALHQPIPEPDRIMVGLGGPRYHCGECGDRYSRVAWPCATARLLGSWPGEPENGSP